MVTLFAYFWLWWILLKLVLPQRLTLASNAFGDVEDEDPRNAMGRAQTHHASKATAATQAVRLVPGHAGWC